MDQRTRKLMTMHKALHLRDNVDWLYVKKRKRESIEDNVDVSIQKLEDDIRTHIGRPETIQSINRTEINRKQKWEERQLYRHFKWQTSEISHEKNLHMAKKGKP